MKPLLATLIATLVAVVGTSGLGLADAQGRCDTPRLPELYLEDGSAVAVIDAPPNSGVLRGIVAAALMSTAAGAVWLIRDCNDDGRVTVDDVTTCANIANMGLGPPPVTTCPPCDCDRLERLIDCMTPVIPMRSPRHPRRQPASAMAMEMAA